MVTVFPVCAETTTDPGGSIDVISVTEHICQGAPIQIQIQGGTNGNSYLLRCYNVAKNNEITERTATLAGQTFILSAIPVGDYYIAIYDPTGTNLYYNGIHSTVHPLRTTWKMNATSAIGTIGITGVTAVMAMHGCHSSVRLCSLSRSSSR